MNYDDLKVVLDTVSGATFAGLDTVTSVKLKGGKKNPMQGRVTKVTEGANTMIFSTTESAYENMVKRRMVNEGLDPESFSVGQRAWGTRIGNSPFIEHNGKKYLEVIFMGAGKTQYFLDGEPIYKEEIEGLPETKVSDESQGGISNKVVIRTFAIDSIREIRVKGDTVN